MSPLPSPVTAVESVYFFASSSHFRGGALSVSFVFLISRSFCGLNCWRRQLLLPRRSAGRQGGCRQGLVPSSCLVLCLFLPSLFSRAAGFAEVSRGAGIPVEVVTHSTVEFNNGLQ